MVSRGNWNFVVIGISAKIYGILIKPVKRKVEEDRTDPRRAEKDLQGRIWSDERRELQHTASYEIRKHLCEDKTAKHQVINMSYLAKKLRGIMLRSSTCRIGR